MTREEFIKKARELNYEEAVIEEMLADIDEVLTGDIDYAAFPLFEQPKGDI